MSIPPDGKMRVQWGTASNADTTTGPTDATPTPPLTPKDSTSASAEGPSFYPFDKDLLVTESTPYPATYEEFRQRLTERMGTPELTLPNFTLGKQGYLVCITDEQLGLAEVWPVTQVSAEAQAAVRKERELQQRQRLITLTARLALAPEALHPIIELHSPGTQSWSLDECQGCDAGAYAEESPEWPCRTINLILEGLQ